MRILITGASGSIGQKLGLKLAKEGHELFVLTRKSEALGGPFPFPCRAFYWKSEGSLPPPESLEGVEAIIHLAGENIGHKRWSSEQKAKIMESRVRPTFFLAQAVRLLKQKPSVIVMASAVGFYGDRREEKLTETSIKGEGFLADVVEAWEKSADPFREMGLRTVHLRLGMVLDSQQGALPKLIFAAQNLLLPRTGFSRHYFPWVHIQDVVRIFAEALVNKKYEGVVNVVAPQMTTSQQFVEDLTGLLKKRPHRNHLFMPKAFYRILLGGMSELVIQSQKVVPQRLLDGGFTFQFPHLSGALLNLFPGDLSEQRFSNQLWVGQKLDSVFLFHRKVQNLKLVTPQKIEIDDQSTPLLEKDTSLKFSMPIGKFKLSWKGRISEYELNVCFVDAHSKGPFRLWRHAHQFVSLAGGTQIEEKIEFRLPLGIVGRILGTHYTHNKLKELFRYRNQKLVQILAKTEGE